MTATKARFASWEKDHRAGALAALIRAAVEADEQEEVARLWAEAGEHGVADVVGALVDGTHPPMRSAAERHYNVLDRLHRRLQGLRAENIRMKFKADTASERELLQSQERDMEEESTALAQVLDEGKRQYREDIRGLVEEGEQLRAARDATEADRADALVDEARDDLPCGGES